MKVEDPEEIGNFIMKTVSLNPGMKASQAADLYFSTKQKQYDKVAEPSVNGNSRAA